MTDTAADKPSLAPLPFFRARRPLTSMGPGRSGSPMAVQLEHRSWSQISHGLSLVFYYRFDRYEAEDPLDAFCAWLDENDVVYRYTYDCADCICAVLAVIPERVVNSFHFEWGYLLDREYPSVEPVKQVLGKGSDRFDVV